jgi:hypothetical protein
MQIKIFYIKQFVATLTMRKTREKDRGGKRENKS